MEPRGARYAFTASGLAPATTQLLRFFAPARLKVDLDARRSVEGGADEPGPGVDAAEPLTRVHLGQILKTVSKVSKMKRPTSSGGGGGEN